MVVVSSWGQALARRYHDASHRGADGHPTVGDRVVVEREPPREDDHHARVRPRLGGAESQARGVERSGVEDSRERPSRDAPCRRWEVQALRTQVKQGFKLKNSFFSFLFFR